VSTSARQFWVNTTLGFLRVAPRTVRLRPPGAAVSIQWSQTRAARVTVRVETMHGVLLKRLAQRAFASGKRVVIWNGRRRDGKLAYGGRYRVLVVARNDLGSVSLEQQLVVRRVKPAK
jgi:flagellar hook assembly protein FlgD